ncbi:tether containing ubx domain for glut4 [Anaeramoeba flamelloides]|uniref:Tether containing ubx domain for glut4 n=1 Tax=Anaeramoeba flamelloides TaxID=1746091 RepID=A0ABQ8XHF6_9EUKA|nr:tether containing ubx domain for glut4 [Anaeramoeba flamelloides]
MFFEVVVQILSFKRETIKIKHDTPLQEILNTVLQRNNLLGSYSLSYRNQTLDLSQSFQKSGVPNHGIIKLTAINTQNKIRVEVTYEPTSLEADEEEEQQKATENIEKFIYKVTKKCNLWTVLRSVNKKRVKLGKTDFLSRLENRETMSENKKVLVPILIFNKNSTSYSNEKSLRKITLEKMGVTSGTCNLTLKFIYQTQNDYKNFHQKNTDQEKKRKQQQLNNSDMAFDSKSNFFNMYENLKKKQEKKQNQKEISLQQEKSRIKKIQKKLL